MMDGQMDGEKSSLRPPLSSTFSQLLHQFKSEGVISASSVNV